MEALICRTVFAVADSRPKTFVNASVFARQRSLQTGHHQRFPRICVPERLNTAISFSAMAASSVEARPSPSKDVVELWKNAEAVCFDVDSTVCTDEGLDELADFCGAGEAVAAWTNRAMSGSVPFEEALSARLSLFKPSRRNLEDFLSKNPPKLTPGIQELVRKLQSKGRAVYLISGGFRQIIAPVAKILQIPEERIFANRLLFDKDGNYTGFDTEEPTSRSGGKAAAIAQIKQKFHYNKLVMIGDGATDLEARQPGGADIFICFAGVQFRAPVAAKSDWCVLNLEDLSKCLDEPIQN